MTRKVFTLDPWGVYVGQFVGDVTWERIIPGEAWQVISRGYDHKPVEENPASRGMWLRLRATNAERGTGDR